jgi:hypothetical protein
MASLYNTLPQDTYSGLIKFIDNTGSAGPIKQLTDGVGNILPISFGTGSIYTTSMSGSFTGSFSGSIVGTITSASYAVTASYALNAGATVSTASLLTTASVNLNVITFTKGDSSTFNLTVNTGSAITVSTASLLTTASISTNVITFTKGDNSTFNLTIVSSSYAINSTTSSYVANASGISNAITNNTNDYILTATGGTTINGEGNLRFDGSALKVTGSVAISSSLAVGNITPSTTVGRIDASNDIVAFSTSDIRLKTNIEPILNPITKIEAIGGYTFDWKSEHKDLHGFEGHDVGVIAQEIEVIMPEVVTTRDSGYKAVKYEKLVPLLIEAIKDLQKQIDELKNR